MQSLHLSLIVCPLQTISTAQCSCWEIPGTLLDRVGDVNVTSWSHVHWQRTVSLTARMLPESTDTFSHVSNIPLDYDDGPFRARYYIGLVHWSLGDDLNSPAASGWSCCQQLKLKLWSYHRLNAAKTITPSVGGHIKAWQRFEIGSNDRPTVRLCHDCFCSLLGRRICGGMCECEPLLAGFLSASIDFSNSYGHRLRVKFHWKSVWNLLRRHSTARLNNLLNWRTRRLAVCSEVTFAQFNNGSLANTCGGLRNRSRGFVREER